MNDPEAEGLGGSWGLFIRMDGWMDDDIVYVGFLSIGGGLRGRKVSCEIGTGDGYRWANEGFIGYVDNFFRDRGEWIVYINDGGNF